MEILEEKVQVWIDSARFVKPRPAIYVFYDRKSTVLFIGAAQNLQEQFTKYLDTDFESDKCKQKTYTYQKLFVDDPDKTQKKMIADFEQSTGSKPICNC